MDRISIEDYYMNIATQVALRSTCIRRRVGAVIVKDNRILATGYNGAPKGIPNCIDECKRCYRSEHNIPSGEQLDKCYAVHAEQNAIMNALKTGEDLTGTSIYVTTFPCATCSKLIIQSGISDVYYTSEYHDEFTKHMIEESGVKLHYVDNSTFQTPIGTDIITNNDLDTIDPLVGQIYKYKPGTEEFLVNRQHIFEKNNLWEKYNEKIYYVNDTYDKEIYELTGTGFHQLVEPMELHEAMRYDLEYNGGKHKQLVVATLLYDTDKEKYVFLKDIGTRLKGKLTMIQGHMSVLPDEELSEVSERYGVTSVNQSILLANLEKELKEEGGIDKPVSILPLYLINSNDNMISSEHTGIVLYSAFNNQEPVSGEPDKHEIVYLDEEELLQEETLNNMDTWLRKVVEKLFDL